ncbi:hypothetical protein DsansV1_C13g0121291 [Dioscorea sansibarensis]
MLSFTGTRSATPGSVNGNVKSTYKDLFAVIVMSPTTASNFYEPGRQDHYMFLQVGHVRPDKDETHKKWHKVTSSPQLQTHQCNNRQNWLYLWHYLC